MKFEKTEVIQQKCGPSKFQRNLQKKKTFIHSFDIIRNFRQRYRQQTI